MKTININKSFNFENGSIEIRYQGVCQKEDVSIDKVESLFDRFIVNHHHRNMIENVAIVRTILKDCEEKSLVIANKNEKETEIVKYDTYHLFSYEYESQKRTREKDQISIKYQPGNTLHFSLEDLKGNLIDYPNYKEMITRFTDLINKLYQLKYVRAIQLDRDSKLLIEIYKLFYNENPDFSKKNIHVKVQAMLAILAEFGFSLGDDYTFRLLKDDKMPVSLNLVQKVNSLFAFGEVSDVDDPVKLEEKVQRTIKIIGEGIRTAICDGYNKDEALITISNIIYAGRFNLSSNYNINELSKFTNRTPNEVKSTIRLIKRIERKMRQENI